MLKNGCNVLGRNHRTVAVGMSGGVDSTVAALLLKKEGYTVIGVYMKNWDEKIEASTSFSSCDKNWFQVEQICKKLDIPAIQMNFTKEYWNNVFDPFLADLSVAYSPNPDIYCNSRIKFGAFYERCQRELGVDLIGFGHYARVQHSSHVDSGNARLFRGFDLLKDQTYFLSHTNPKILNHTLFPLGAFTKVTVKEIARQNSFKEIADQKESMGICFIGKRSFGSFVNQYLDPSLNVPGFFKDYTSKEILGKHKGISLYTIGQRARIPGFVRKMYIAEKNPSTGTILLVDSLNHPSLLTTRVEIKNLLFFGDWNPSILLEEWKEKEKAVTVKLRHADSPVPVSAISFEKEGDNTFRMVVTLKDAVGRVGKGQQAALYLGLGQEELVIGGQVDG